MIHVTFTYIRHTFRDVIEYVHFYSRLIFFQFVAVFGAATNCIIINASVRQMVTACNKKRDAYC